jgi:hypothetical protein
MVMFLSSMVTMVRPGRSGSQWDFGRISCRPDGPLHTTFTGVRGGGGKLRRMRWVGIIAALALAGCSRGGSEDTMPPRPARALTGAQAHAPAPATAGALAQVPDGAQARRRLGYVDLERLAAAELPFSARAVAARVVGRAPSGATAVVKVGDGPAHAPAGPAPETSAITPAAQSAVQSCLGDALAQTIVGMGHDAALGVGLAESDDPPAGLQLRLCGAPRYIRHLHDMERALERHGVAAAEREIGEREIVAGVVAADALPPHQVLRLLAGGRELRALAWR